MFMVLKYSTSDNVNVWPEGHEKPPGPGGDIITAPLILPFLPDDNVTEPVTGPETVVLLAAAGQFPPLFTQTYVAEA